MPAPGAPGPAALADPDDVEPLLTGVGFEAVELTSFEEPLWFGADADAAYAFVGGIGIVRGLSSRRPAPANGVDPRPGRSAPTAGRTARSGPWPSLLSSRGRQTASFVEAELVGVAGHLVEHRAAAG